jgi:hypothetical protein
MFSANMGGMMAAAGYLVGMCSTVRCSEPSLAKRCRSAFRRDDRERGSAHRAS